MKNLSIISLALLPIFAACGNANGKTTESAETIKTTSDKIIVISNYHDDGEKDLEDATFWSYQETPEGSAFTCKGPKGVQTFVFEEKYNISQYQGRVFTVDYGEEAINPFSSYWPTSGGVVRGYPTTGIAIQTNGHILLLIRENSEQVYTGYRIVNVNVVEKDSNGKDVRFIEFEGKNANPEGRPRFTRGLLQLYTPTNSPSKSSADNLIEKTKGMDKVRVF